MKPDRGEHKAVLMDLTDHDPHYHCAYCEEAARAELPPVLTPEEMMEAERLPVDADDAEWAYREGYAVETHDQPEQKGASR